MERKTEESLMLRQAEELLRAEPDAVAALSNLSALLMENLSNLNWAGFYLVRGDQLVLGPFQGKPACIHIPFGKGVCGTSLERNETIRVPDVHAFPGHIACDSASASEIVVPIREKGRVRAVMDLDSPVKDRFSEKDQVELEGLAGLIEKHVCWDRGVLKAPVSDPAVPFSGYLNAYTFGFCEKQGFTERTAWRHSLEAMALSTGCNAVILPVCAWQDHPWSTRVDSLSPDVMSAEDVRRVCGEARKLGLKVILKAMVNCRDGAWRAYIHFMDHPVKTEPSWADWFAGWDAHVLRVAEMAAENAADMFCIGCEMVSADPREEEWRSLIERVRKVYAGPLTYNCDKYQEDRVTWWDAVDVISSSGYYPLEDIDQELQRIEAVARAANRPFLFMECGCPSRQGSEHRPNDWNYGGETSMEAQRRWYQAFTEALLRFPFVRGCGWWDWPASRLYPEFAGEDNNGYCTWGKPANQTLHDFAVRLKLSEA